MEIPKYKAWDKIGKRMFDVRSIDFFGKVAQLDGNGQYVMDCLQCPNMKCFSPFYNLDRLDLLHYIGRNDKDGTEIYEGFIVEAGTINGTKIDKDGGAEDFDYPVETRFAIKDIRHLPFEGNRHDGGWFEYGELKVIGTIYENPELLENNPKC